MAGYKTPDFTQRAEAARVAKERALEKLRTKAAPDPALVAERQAAQAAREAAREAAAAERRAVRQAAIDEAKAVKEAAKAKLLEEQEAAARKPEPVQKTEAELKAARDARYAARKARKR